MVSEDTVNSSDDTQTFVLLGASNLTIGWAAVVQSLLEISPGPVEVFAALGMGRSYIKRSRFAARELPGIVQSGIWQALPTSPPVAPQILITDVGNDLVYGSELNEITDAITLCIERFRNLYPACRISMTTLPMDSINGLGRWRFEVFRRILFPGLRQDLAEIKTKSADLNHCLQELATQHDLTIVQPIAQWYGLDPIHIRRRDRRAAFAHIFQPFHATQRSAPATTQRPGFRLPPRAASSALFGRERLQEQPCQTLGRLTVHAY